MNPLKIFFGIFTAIGIFCLLLSVPFFYLNILRAMRWETVEGTVIAPPQKEFPAVAFPSSRPTDTLQLNVRGGNLVDGYQVTIRHPKGRPDMAEMASFIEDWLFPLVAALMALVFGGVGITGFRSINRLDQMKRELFEKGQGTLVKLPIQSVALDASIRINRRHPWIIKAQYSDKISGSTFSCRSSYIWKDPTPHMEGRKTVDVYIDPQNPKRYWMDITFLS